jgi:hypothetical protein
MGAVTLSDPRETEDCTIHEMIFQENQLVPSIEWKTNQMMADSVCILNDVRQVMCLQDPHFIKKHLQMHGLSYAPQSPTLREYKVFVFQTEVLITYVARKGSQQNTEQKRNHPAPFLRLSAQSNTKEIKKIRELAIRTVYALGLDYALVWCAIGPGRRQIVKRVIVDPRCSTTLEKKICQALLQYSSDLSEPRRRQIVLGADPEFVIRSKQGRLLLASQFFSMKGKVGCDAIWIGENRQDKPLFELRPEPSSNPKVLAARIYEGLLIVAKKVNHLSDKWLAGNMPIKGFPIGGHIHFSGIKPNFKLLRALDNYLTLPLMMAEDSRGVKRRPKYGYLGDYRMQPYGGFEYRTPPSWLVSPTLTKGVFALAKCIANNYQRLKYDPFRDPDLQEAYYQGDKDRIAPWIDLLWSELYSFADYQTYERELSSFFSYIRQGRRWNEYADFRKAWKIPTSRSRKN